jgi:dethiobiotin synthetase
VRPERLVVVLGTATSVGKTWVSAKVLARLKTGGATVAARKPVQSFAHCDVETDAHLLGLATGEPPETVCARHRWYPVAMAPPIAAAFVGAEPPALDDLVAELDWPTPAVDVGVLETAGGPRSPIATDADSAALAAAADADLHVLVAHAGLGAINAVRLSVPVLPEPVVVFLNRFDNSDVHDRNRRWLEADGFDVVVDLAELTRRVAGADAKKPPAGPAAR